MPDCHLSRLSQPLKELEDVSYLDHPGELGIAEIESIDTSWLRVESAL